MEFKVIKESVATNEVVCDSFTELPIEYDMLLPDYCPDIMKILKCCARPVFTRTEVDGGLMTAEGHVQLSLYYLTESMQMRCCESRAPFTKTVDLKCAPENTAVSVFGHTEYLNCRATSPRRVDVRGAVTMGTKVLAQKDEELVADAVGGGIQLRRERLDSMCLVGAAQRQFTVREELELPEGKPTVGVVVRRSMHAAVTDKKVIPGKIILKGDLVMELFYLSGEDEAPASMRYTLPISQIVDLAGVDEGCRCSARFDVTGGELQPKADLDGETTLLSAEVPLTAHVQAYRPTETAAVSDAYSTAAQAVLTQRPISAMRLVEEVDGEHAYSEQMELPEGAEEVLEMWCEAVYTGCHMEDGAAKLGVRISLCMFALDTGHSPAYFEKTMELEHTLELHSGGEGLFADIFAQAGACEFSMAGTSVEIRCPVRLTGMVFAVVKCLAAGELAVDEAKPHHPGSEAALTIYFAQAGECVWDIAKRYQTSVDAVMEENAIEHETLEGRATLLIPMVV